MIDPFGAFKPDHASDTVTIPRAELEAKEIARLIEELSCTEGPGGPFVLPVICQEAATALRALAQENERLLQSLNISHELELRERIAELEAERDRAIIRGNQQEDRAEKAEYERDAIRAKTFEECAKHLDACDYWDSAREIRALAQTDEATDVAGTTPDSSSTKPPSE